MSENWTMPKEELFLKPEEFLSGKAVVFEIGEVRRVVRESKSGNAYTDYSLVLLGAFKDRAGDFVINYLFPRDFSKLREEFGDNPQTWKGKQIEVSARKEGEFNRWILAPLPELVN